MLDHALGLDSDSCNSTRARGFFIFKLVWVLNTRSNNISHGRWTACSRRYCGPKIVGIATPSELPGGAWRQSETMTGRNETAKYSCDMCCQSECHMKRHCTSLIQIRCSKANQSICLVWIITNSNIKSVSQLLSSLRQLLKKQAAVHVADLLASKATSKQH